AIAGRDLVIQTSKELPVRSRLWKRRVEVLLLLPIRADAAGNKLAAGDVIRRRRIPLLELLRYSIEHVGRNAVASVFLLERLADRIGIAMRVISNRLAGRVVNRQHARKVAGHGRFAGNVIRCVAGGAVVDNLVIVEEEEELVFLDRATNLETKIVKAQVRNRRLT